MSDSQTIQSYNTSAADYAKNRPSSFYHKYLEKPAMFSMLPDLNGKKVLCIGVGTGNEANELKNFGAEVTGIDISEGMLAEARNNFPEIEFIQMDMLKLDFKSETFDFVYSSLALHYAEDLKMLFNGIYRILKHKGELLFSTTHPIFDSTDRFSIADSNFTVIGHEKLSSGKSIAHGDYFTEEQRTQDWGNNFIVNFHHYTISTWINALVDSDFKLTKVSEPFPVEESKELFTGYYEIYSHRPAFIVFKASKI